MSAVPETHGFDAAAFVAAAVARLDDALVVVPAPRIEPEAFLAAGGEPILWCAPGEEPIAATGIAARVDAAGVERFARVRDAGAALLRSIETVSGGGAPRVPPRLFGGFAFDVSGASAAPWDAFGDASFTLPRWVRGGSWLALQVTARDSAATRAALVEEVSARLAGAALPGARPRAGALRRPRAASWRSRVDRALAAIAAGRVAKVVVSERATASCEAPPLAVAARLRSAPGWRFLFRRGGATLLGVSPERLVRRTGRTVEVDALAGSRGGDDGEALRSSGKDRAEQRIVAEEIARTLGAFCGRIAVPSEPSPKRFGGIAHLHTALTGTLARDAHVLDLAAALHPTPAVGGAPRDAALEEIRRIEDEPRGWWAGPVGWFDAAGDGELVVAIRSVLLDGTTAYLRAGAGIVPGSEPDAERAEVALKRRALVEALGGSVPEDDAGEDER